MKKGKSQIGILGGSFDPVHMGHIGLAEETYNKFNLDKILFIPVFQSPHKAYVPFASVTDRKEMLRLALKENSGFIISDIEARIEKISYTIETLNYYESKFKNSELFFIIGYDNLLDFDSWKDSRKIMNKFNILVASRPGQQLISPEDKVLGFFNGDSPYKLSNIENGMKKFLHSETRSTLVVFDINPRDISSREVREKLAYGKPTKNLLPPEVEAYIIRHQIYQTRFQPNIK